MNLRFWQWYVDRIKIIEMVLEELYRQGHEDGEKDVNIFIYFFVYTDGRQIKGKKIVTLSDALVPLLLLT